MIPIGVMASGHVPPLAEGGLAATVVGVYTLPDEGGSLTRTISGIDAGGIGPAWLAGFIGIAARSVTTLESGYGPVETLTPHLNFVQGFYVQTASAESVTFSCTISNSSTAPVTMQLWRMSDAPSLLLDHSLDTSSPYELTPPARPGGLTLVMANTTVASRPRTLTGWTEGYRDNNTILGHTPANGGTLTYSTDRASLFTTVTLV